MEFKQEGKGSLKPFSSEKKKVTEVSEMVQRVKVSTTKSVDLSS